MNYILLFSVLYSVLFILLYRFITAPKFASEKLKNKQTMSDYLPYIICLAAIFLLELVSSQIIAGHKQDSNLFKAWTSFGINHKMSEYYRTDLYVDYPPVYLMILYVVGKIAAFLGLQPGTDAYVVAIKFVPVLCDSVFTAFVFIMAKDTLGVKKAGALSLMTAINPFTVVNSAIWGQVDIFVFLITLAMLFTLYNKKYVLSCGIFMLSILTKPQMIIFAPLMGFTVFFDFIEVYKDKKQRNYMIKQMLLSIAAMVAVLLIVPMPIVGTDYKLLLDNFAHAMGMYPYSTLNAANLYGAFGLNWANVNDVIFIGTTKQWGFAFIVLISLTVGYVTYKVRDRKKIFYLGAFTVLAIYMLAHTMHERYLYTAIPLLLIIYIFTKDKSLLWVYGGLSLTNFINISRVLALNLKDDFIYGDNVGFIITSWINLILFAAFIWIGYRALFLNKTEDPVVEKISDDMKRLWEKPDKNIKKSFSFQKEEASVRVTRKDVLIIAGITLLYSVFAFWHLGSTNVPESGWYVENAGETVTVEFGKKQAIKQIYVYSGWIDRRESDSVVERAIDIEVSSNGTRWTKLDKPMELKNVWRWTVHQIDTEARFIRFTNDDGRFYINELAFFGETSKDRIKPIRLHGDNASPGFEALIDEQDRVVHDFTWYDGTYFDEIYHPRTAYEHLTNRYPYENTHPPLGKVIISVGIALFGMNPFGWRFFGTLCGVLMVPMAYMLGKRLFKNTFFAFCTAVLMTFDFMHLSQTRLATIDSYTAFFVMGMYYFMYRYISQSFYNVGVKKTLPSLFMSGLFFGLGAATKWQGIYAGIGLAFLFFASLVRRYLEYKEALKKSKKDEEMRKIVRNFVPMTVQTVIYATIFFVVVPGLVYFLSYIPAMNTPATGLDFFFSNQSHMLNYHGGLKSEHPYGSAWWSWPLDMRPLYAYSPNRLHVPQGYSQGISSFGNPFVWWLTIPVIAAAIYKCIKKKGDNELMLILAGFGAMYLPWVLVSRVAFIYHFFPCVIFVVLGIVYFIKEIVEKRPDAKKYVYAYLIAVFVLFVAFYPVLAGVKVPTSYVEMLKWLPTWVLG